MRGYQAALALSSRRLTGTQSKKGVCELFCHMHKYLAVASRRRLKGSQLGSSGQPGIQGSRRHAQRRLTLAHLPRLFLKQRHCILALLLPCTIRPYLTQCQTHYPWKASSSLLQP